MSNPEKRAHTLVIPRWYPYPDDPQLGVFVKKHAMAAAAHGPVSVLYIRGSDHQDSVMTTLHSGLLEVVLQYKRSPLLLTNIVRYIQSAREGIDQVRARQGDIHLVNYSVLSLIAAWFRFFSPLRDHPYVITEHWSGYLSGTFSKKDHFSKRIYRRLAAGARIIMPVSDTLRLAMQRCKLHGRYQVVPNVVATCERNGGQSQPNHVVAVADLVDEIKNISGLLDAFRMVRSEIPEIRLTIAGDGPDWQMLEKKAKETGGHVEFTGRLSPEEVAPLLKSATVVVISSHYETFSMIAAESLACGTPVVSTRCGGPEEFITEETGLLVPAENTRALADAILDVVSGRRTFDADAMQKSVSKFAPEVVGQTLHDIYHDAVS